MHFDFRHLGRAGEQIIGKRGGQRLCACVVAHPFVQRVADAVDRTADQLAFDDHRIDQAAAIVDDDVAQNAHAAGFSVDLHLDRMAPHAVGQRIRQERLQAFQSRLEVPRHRIAGHAGNRFGDLTQRHAAARSADNFDAAVTQFEVLDSGFEEMRGNAEHLLAHGDRRHMHGGAGGHGLPAGKAALPVRNDGGVAGHHRHGIGRNDELLGTYLCKRSLDALPHRHGTRIDRDAARAANPHDAGLERSAPRPLHAIADADTEIAIVFARAALALGKSSVVDGLERHVEAARKIAAVERHRRTGAGFQRRDIGHLLHRHEIAPPHLGAIEPEHMCNSIEHALHGERGFRIAGAPHRHGRDFVGLDHEHA